MVEPNEVGKQLVYGTSSYLLLAVVAGRTGNHMQFLLIITKWRANCSISKFFHYASDVLHFNNLKLIGLHVIHVRFFSNRSWL